MNLSRRHKDFLLTSCLCSTQASPRSKPTPDTLRGSLHWLIICTQSTHLLWGLALGAVSFISSEKYIWHLAIIEVPNRVVLTFPNSLSGWGDNWLSKVFANQSWIQKIPIRKRNRVWWCAYNPIPGDSRIPEAHRWANLLGDVQPGRGHLLLLQRTQHPCGGSQPSVTLVLRDPTASSVANGIEHILHTLLTWCTCIHTGTHSHTK